MCTISTIIAIIYDPNVSIGNIYPLCYAQTFYDGMTEAGQSNVVNLLRCAWAGSQRYGAPSMER